MENQTDSKNATQHGKNEGTKHFLHQRITGAVNVVLMVFLVWLVMNLAQADRGQIASMLSNPVIAGFLVLSIVSVCWHMALGLQVVIEDYVPKLSLRNALTKANSFFAIGIAGVSIFSVLNLSFGG